MNLSKLSFLLFFLFSSYFAFSQCGPVFFDKDNKAVTSGTYCVNELVPFKANSPGYSTTVSWDFGDGFTSSQNDVDHAFTVSGTYSVKFSGTGPAGTCNKTLDVTIKSLSQIVLNHKTDSIQCFEGNQFCFRDSSYSTDTSTIVRQTYLFSHGVRIDSFSPTFPYTFCHSFPIDAKAGGWYTLIVESEKSNGCVTRKIYDDFVFLAPKIDAQFLNKTPAPNPGCDSTYGRFENISTTPLSKIAEFCWDFGDGTIICGDSITNTDWWYGKNNDGIVNHVYNQNGSFDVTLTVKAKFFENGDQICEGSFTRKSAVTNLVLEPEILSERDSSVFGQNPITFKVKGGPPSYASAWLWNFGDPQSGPYNFNDDDWEVSHNYGLGPFEITLRIIAGPCDVTVYDTITINGPRATIEVPYDRVATTEKYQCSSTDSIHFPNNSTFYHNDDNFLDEDSTITVNGKSVFVFNANDHAPATSFVHYMNRTMGGQVLRVWDFGDKYAEACTTDIANNINVGKNCNYSKDQNPVHKYTDWNDIYTNFFYNTNHEFEHFTFNYDSGTCSILKVDTSSPTMHRFIFSNLIPTDYKATLWLKDTLTGAESTDEVKISIGQADASGMTVNSHKICPYDGSNYKNLIEFDLSGTMPNSSRSYLAVNFDSLADPSNFINATSGAILAPPRPGTPYPYVFPPEITGGFPNSFIKGYSPGELANYYDRKPYGAITMGIIVGNGAIDVNGNPECADTAWYPNIVNFDYLNTDFDIYTDNDQNGAICAGESAYFKFKDEINHNVKTLSWNWGYQGVGKGYNYDTYFENFYYLEDYNGPSPTRNDKDVNYNGEDWKYSYVIRSTLNDVTGLTILDTVVTAIHKEWKTETDISTLTGGTLPLIINDNNTYHEPLDKSKIHLLLGDASSCIDTTGLSSQIDITVRGYSNYDNNIVRHGNKRYRYLNANKTDSIEVAEILHFRDSSLRGYDMLVKNGDTIDGVWKHTYTYQEKVNHCGVKDTVTKNATGPMLVGLSLSSTNGCSQHNAQYLNVGFLNNYWLLEDAVCNGQQITLEDSIRYWQYTDQQWPNDYPINPIDYWHTPARYLNGLEIYEVDWDASDGLNDFERSLNLNHVYDDPGTYTLTVHTKDSLGCNDTALITAFISGFEADFSYDSSFEDCDPIFTFYPSSTFSNHCLDKSGCNNVACDSLVFSEWKLNPDDIRRTYLREPAYLYETGGTKEVKVTFRTQLGCEDSVSKTINVPGRDPVFDFKFPDPSNPDTLVIDKGDSVTIYNTSDRESTDDFEISWGDGAITNCDLADCSHTYNDSGIFNIQLTQFMLVSGTNIRCNYLYPDTSNVKQFVVVVKDKASIDELNAENISIYPNPNQGSFSITTEAKINKITLFDINGKSISVDLKFDGSTRVNAVVSGIEVGIYYLKVETDKGESVKKIMIN